MSVVQCRLRQTAMPMQTFCGRFVEPEERPVGRSVDRRKDFFLGRSRRTNRTASGAGEKAILFRIQQRALRSSSVLLGELLARESLSYPLKPSRRKAFLAWLLCSILRRD